jgi:hypothetical protein
MKLEAAAHLVTDRFRLSPVGFCDSLPTGIEDGIPIIENPAEHINPLGGPVEDLTIFAFGDTHFHIPERVSFDRTAVLPTTVAMSALRGVWRQQNGWHQTVRPALYNRSLADWPDQVSASLGSNDNRVGENTLIIHTGDIGDDSLNRSELSSAMRATSEVIVGLRDAFDTFSNGQTNIVSIQGIGDHDADYRAWPKEARTDQVHWFYDQLGLYDEPACFLQEIGSARNSDKAVLVVDTNLMEEAWVEEMHIAALRSLARLTSKAQPSNMPDFDGAPMTGDRLLRDIVLYRNILRNKERQENIIRQAQIYNETIILGHKPNVLQKIAKDCDGEATIIAGHWHVPYNSDQVGSIHLPTQKSRSGKPIRMLVVAPPSRGLVGVEVAAKQVAYMIHLSAGQTIEKEDIITVGPHIK